MTIFSRFFPFSRYVVEGNSMFPTYKKGDQIISFNWAYSFSSPKVGDIVVLRHQNLAKIKRIRQIDKKKVFAVGDNEKESTDSRHFGWINFEQIVGKVVYKITKLR